MKLAGMLQGSGGISVSVGNGSGDTDEAATGGTPDYSLPASVLRAFIRAMHQAESDAYQAHRASRDDSAPFDFGPIVRKQQEIFALCCTAREQPYGRSGSIGQPFDYEPGETLHAVEMVSASRAELSTRQAAGRPLRRKPVCPVEEEGTVAAGQQKGAPDRPYVLAADHP
jgi:hypothetical protein